MGIWAYDSDRVVIRKCFSHDNLSRNHDGGGFDLDITTSNSVIENCTTSNNYGVRRPCKTLPPPPQMGSSR